MTRSLSDISAFEDCRTYEDQPMSSPMSMFTLFRVTVPDIVERQSPGASKIKYRDRSGAEEIAKGWRDMQLKIEHGPRNKKIYTLIANSQKFTAKDKAEATAAMKQAKESKVVEI